jgi:hypothetical protein
MTRPKKKHPQTHPWTLSKQNKERILKPAKERRQVTYKGKSIRKEQISQLKL